MLCSGVRFNASSLTAGRHRSLPQHWPDANRRRKRIKIAKLFSPKDNEIVRSTTAVLVTFVSEGQNNLCGTLFTIGIIIIFVNYTLRRKSCRCLQYYIVSHEPSSSSRTEGAYGKPHATSASLSSRISCACLLTSPRRDCTGVVLLSY